MRKLTHMSNADWKIAVKLFREGARSEAACIKEWAKRVAERRAYYRRKEAERRARNMELSREQNRASYARHAEQRRIEARNRRKEVRLNPIKQGAVNRSRNNYRRTRRCSDRNYQVICVLRNRVKEAVRKQYGKKATKTKSLIGCTVERCRLHIESMWTPGMSWNNYGVKGWHIDHIRPCASFDLTDPEQQKECFHYTNLQPLWWFDNLSKGCTT